MEEGGRERREEGKGERERERERERDQNCTSYRDPDMCLGMMKTTDGRSAEPEMKHGVFVPASPRLFRPIISFPWHLCCMHDMSHMMT